MKDQEKNITFQVLEGGTVRVIPDPEYVFLYVTKKQLEEVVAQALLDAAPEITKCLVAQLR